MTAYYRQGDMFICKADAFPDSLNGIEDVRELTLGIGEVTGHSHRLVPVAEGKISVARGWNANREQEWFRVEGKAVLLHEEHRPIVLEDGIYVRLHQQTYDFRSKKQRGVYD